MRKQWRKEGRKLHELEDVFSLRPFCVSNTSLTCLWSSNLHPLPPSPELGFQRPWGLVWLQALEGSWRLCGALRTSGITGTFGTQGLYGVLGFFCPWWYFYFFTGSFISIHIKNIGEMIFRHKMATTEPQLHFCAFVKKPIVLMFFL